ncbi:MAG: hypothetical protein ACPGJS_00675 [Flammeovirgaceae bacterium]
MAIQLIYQPPELSLSGNPIAFQIQTDAQKVSCSLYLEDAFGSGNYQLIHTEIRPVDGNGQLVFDFGAVLHAELQLAPYDFAATTLQEGRTACRRYFLAFREGVFDVVTTEATDLLSATKYALKATRHFMKYVPDQLPFSGNQLLSLRPAVRSFLPGQKEWLWLLPNASNQAITVDYTVTTGDGNIKVGDPLNFGSTEKYLPIAIPLQVISDLEYALDSNLQSIQLQVLDQELVLQNTFEGLPHVREFHFENTLGGFDSLITYGKAQLTENFTAQTARNYTAFPAMNREYARHNVEAKQTIRVNMGYRSLEEREAAKALLHAQLAFERVNDQSWPILITSTRIQDEKDGEYRYNLQFDYQYAFDTTPLWPSDY